MTLHYNRYYLNNFQNTCGLQSEQNVNPFLAFCAFFSEFGNFETVAHEKEEAFIVYIVPIHAKTVTD